MSISRAGVGAAAASIAHLVVSGWVLKVLGPRPGSDDDYWCNCSVLEGNALLFAWPIVALTSLVFALVLLKARGVDRVLGIVAGVLALLLPVLTIVGLVVIPFPTIDELMGR